MEYASGRSWPALKLQYASNLNFRIDDAPCMSPDVSRTEVPGREQQPFLTGVDAAYGFRALLSAYSFGHCDGEIKTSSLLLFPLY